MENPGAKKPASVGSVDTTDFRELAARIRDSDRAAFATLFQVMSVKLVRFARSITHDEASAHDILQDVFLKLWTVRERIDPASSIKSLLYTMTRNASLNFTRKQGTLVFEDDESETHFADVHNRESRDIGHSMEAKVDAKNLAGMLYRWIDELPKRRREAFVLSRHHDLTHKEISAIMGLSERTVNTHIFLALKHLRSRLDDMQNAAN